ncbi:hypothetical protein [Haloferula sp.]|uniref:hypothetical protein n=1 Tax=Haloferula sp. TaxID=2497595 RepID=UPI003C71E5F2
MNEFPSPKGPSAILFSTNRAPKASPRLPVKRLAAALTSATLAIAASACSHSSPASLDQVGVSSGVTVLSISAYDGHDTPSFAEVHTSESPQTLQFSDELGTDYLSGLLRDLPWKTGSEHRVSNESSTGFQP